MSQNRTLEGPPLDTAAIPEKHRSNTGVVRGVQDSRRNVRIAGFRGKRFRLTGRRVGSGCRCCSAGPDGTCSARAAEEGFALRWAQWFGTGAGCPANGSRSGPQV
jgi:hypothetical protein